jgi:hypothetical protein
MSLLKFIVKGPLLFAILSSAWSQAQDLKIENHVNVQSCPENFYTLPLYPNAKFCRLFAEGLPSSMSYFASSNQKTTKAFYVEQLGQAEDEKILHGRIVLQYSNGQKVVVISKDGKGSQIDILIKSEE